MNSKPVGFLLTVTKARSGTPKHQRKTKKKTAGLAAAKQTSMDAAAAAVLSELVSIFTGKTKTPKASLGGQRVFALLSPSHRLISQR